jgi:hypothetical protein
MVREFSIIIFDLQGCFHKTEYFSDPFVVLSFFLPRPTVYPFSGSYSNGAEKILDGMVRLSSFLRKKKITNMSGQWNLALLQSLIYIEIIRCILIRSVTGYQQMEKIPLQGFLIPDVVTVAGKPNAPEFDIVQGCVRLKINIWLASFPGVGQDAK